MGGHRGQVNHKGGRWVHIGDRWVDIGVAGGWTQGWLVGGHRGGR